MKPYSEACDQNKAPILGVLGEVLAPCRQVLEIGSGTGQHAAFFPASLTHLTWIPSDVAENIPGIQAWLDEARLGNVAAPVVLDVNLPDWPVTEVDGVFSANTAHIMSWPTVVNMFAGVARVLAPAGVFALYGPFNYQGRYTSASNERFDQWLKGRDPDSGLRDVEALDALAVAGGLALSDDFEMPVNNRTLVWRKARG